MNELRFLYYWEDFTPGRVLEHGARTLSEEEIIGFAREWDPQRFHIDPQAAKDTPYGGVIASGWHTGCVLMRLMCDAYLSESRASARPASKNSASHCRCGRAGPRHRQVPLGPP